MDSEKPTFVCECADENCTRKLDLTVGEYAFLGSAYNKNKSKRRYIVHPECTSFGVDEVLVKESKYFVIGVKDD